MERLPKNINIFQKAILKKSLTLLTKEIILGDLLDQDIARVEIMKERKSKIETGSDDPISELFWLIEDCKRWGTLPFAGLARAAFVATQILKSLEVTLGKQDLLSSFTRNLNTITSQMSNDLNNLNKGEFLEKYGHLRPGAYNITSMTYKEGFSFYFSEVTSNRLTSHNEEEMFDIKPFLEMANIFSEIGVTSSEFTSFAKRAIYWREQAKFEFTKNLSRVLDLIQQIGIENGFTRDDLAFLDIRILKDAYSNALDLKGRMEQNIDQGKRDFRIAVSVDLPAVISESGEIFSFLEEDSSPNFITGNRVTGLVSADLREISGKIVLIEGADPGYDWIFQKNILGLITAYGGANSHMAVRCFELGVPAAIGVGDRLFKEIKSAFQVNLDCGNRIIEYA